MNVTDLTINNWVRVNGSPRFYQITSIDRLYKGYAFRLEYNDYVVDTWYDNLSPIPITEEILKKNGFSVHKNSDNGIEHIQCFLQKDTEFQTVKYGIDISWRNDDTVKILRIETNLPPIVEHLGIRFAHLGMQFNYVHELQNALRICGLYEIANNFKV